MEKPFVLLADDNDATCTLITALLDREFRIEIARDGSEAIEQLRTRQFAAVLLDLRMPIVDGFSVLDFVATNRPEMMNRMIVLTAALSSGEMERVHHFPIFTVVRKPFEVDHLLTAVRRCASHGDHPMSSPFVSTSLLLLVAELMRHRWM
ncbi:MAG TPA: response regulator [Thermoanaerobaculia bacterium]|nr:response regulator [Thermoanaerobaculia bacterium]